MISHNLSQFVAIPSNRILRGEGWVQEFILFHKFEATKPLNSCSSLSLFLLVICLFVYMFVLFSPSILCYLLALLVAIMVLMMIVVMSLMIFVFSCQIGSWPNAKNFVASHNNKNCKMLVYVYIVKVVGGLIFISMHVLDCVIYEHVWSLWLTTSFTIYMEVWLCSKRRSHPHPQVATML